MSNKQPLDKTSITKPDSRTTEDKQPDTDAPEDIEAQEHIVKKTKDNGITSNGAQNAVASVSPDQRAEEATIVASTKFTNNIAINPYTLTKKVDNFGRSWVSEISHLLRKNEHNPVHPRVTYTTRVVHLLKLYINNGAGAPTYSESRPVDLIAGPLLDQLGAPFMKGVKHALMGIDANFGGKFRVDPYNNMLLETDTLSAMDATTSAIQYMSTSGYPTEPQKSVQHLYNSIVATIQFATHAGGYAYISNKEHVTDYGATVPRSLGSDTPLHDMSIPGMTHLDTDGPDSIADMRFGVNPGPDLGHITNNIPKDDYLNYPLVAFTPFSMPNNNHRNYCRNQLTTRIEYGVQSVGVGAVSGMKISETIILPTDVPSAYLQSLSQRDLQQHRVDDDELATFLGSMYPKREWFNDNVANFKFYSPLRATRTQMDDMILQTYIIADDRAKDAYRMAELLHPSLLSDTFRQLVTFTQGRLATFPLLTLDASLTNFTSAEANASQPGLNMTINALTMSTVVESPEEIAIKMVLSLMAPYVLLKCTPSTFDQTRSPQYFIQDLLGLVIGNIMYRHLHLRNKAARMQTFHDFLLAYFRTEYSALFAIQGFGTDARGNVISSIIGRDRITCPVVNWTIDAVGVGQRSLLHDVCNLLSLSNNVFSVIHQIPANRYRVSARSCIIPGNCTGPSFGSATVMPLLAVHLTSIVDGVGQRFFKEQMGMLMMPVKIQVAAFHTLLGGFKRAIESFVRWFEQIYNPIYRLVSTLPILTMNDVTQDYSEQVAFRDRIKDDQPLYNLSVPHSTPTPVVLIGIPDSLFGAWGARSSFGLMLTAVVPGAYVQGMSINKKLDINEAAFNTLYSPVGVHEIVLTYFNQMYRRLLALEGLELAESVARGNFLDDIPDVRDCIRDALRTTKVSAAAMSILQKSLGYTEATINSDREIMAHREGVISSLLQDPRFARPVVTYITYAAPDGVARSERFVSRVRPYVLESAKYLVKLVFGRRGMKPVKRGITLSTSPLPGLTFQSIHPLPSIRAVIDPTQRITYGDNANIIKTYIVRVHYNQQNVITYEVQTPHELLNRISAVQRVNALPAYTIQVDNPSRITSVQATFAHAALQFNHAVIRHTGAYTIPHLSLMGSAEADQSTNNMTVNDVLHFMATPIAYMTDITMTDISLETGGTLLEEVVRLKLPTDPTAEAPIMKGFYANNIIPNITSLNARVALVPAYVAPGHPPMVYDGGMTRIAHIHAPLNQLSLHTSFTRPPIISTWLADASV